MLAEHLNVDFHEAGVGDPVLPANSQDFGYSLEGSAPHSGYRSWAFALVLLYSSQARPFWVYLYYAFDNRSFIFKLVWRCSDWLRKGICLLPSGAEECSNRYHRRGGLLPLGTTFWACRACRY